MRSIIRFFLLISLLNATLVALGTPFLNEDLFMAFCSGRDTLAKGPACLNDWSFTIPPRVWVDQSWLSHLTYFLSYNIAGAFGPVFIKAILLLGCLAVICIRCLSLGISLEASLLAATLGTFAFAPFLSIRGENFGMLLLVLLFAVLTAAPSWGRWRHLAALAILALLSNSHGSFMMGFFVLALRLCVALEVKWSHRGQATDSDADVGGWLVTCVLSVVVMALCNPYGLENLWMPFRQLLETSVSPSSLRWGQWDVLIDLTTIQERGLLKPYSGVPFLILLFGTLTLVLLILGTEGRAGLRCVLLDRLTGPGPLMVVVTPLLLLPLAFRFSRLVLFVAPVMVPMVALVLEGVGDMFRKRWRNRGLLLHGATGLKVGAGVAIGWMVLTSWLLYRSTILVHVPWNPLNYLPQAQTLTSRLMTANSVWAEVAEFLRKNKIHGRIYANEVLSDYLLFFAPGVRVFFDLRAQSAYPPAIVDAYGLVQVGGVESLDRAMDVLDRFQVEYLVVDTRFRPFSELAVSLMRTKRWGCIYRDSWVFVLARTDSPRFGSLIRSGRLDSLSYDRPETAALSLAFLHLFMNGSIPAEVVTRLTTAVRDHPDPNAYTLIVEAMNGRGPCLNDLCRLFLEREAERLSKEDFIVSAGCRTTMAGLLRVLSFMQRHETVCGPPDAPKTYTTMRREYKGLLSTMERHYGGL